MRLVRIAYQHKEQWGIVSGETIQLLDDNPFVVFGRTRKKIPLRSAKLLPPTVPSKVILVGLNYKDHARELKMQLFDEPIIFLKPSTALLAHDEEIVYPSGVAQLDYEAELALVIKKEGSNIPEKKAGDYILGYTCLNDVTARDLQKKDGQWTRAKSFDTFCPLGPWIETDFDVRAGVVQSYVNGELRQSSSLKNLIFSIPHVVSFISKIMTLKPGDVISTGTPPGVGPMKPGDTVEVVIKGVGCLRNRVVARKK